MVEHDEYTMDINVIFKETGVTKGFQDLSVAVTELTGKITTLSNVFNSLNMGSSEVTKMNLGATKSVKNFGDGFTEAILTMRDYETQIIKATGATSDASQAFQRLWGAGTKDEFQNAFQGVGREVNKSKVLTDKFMEDFGNVHTTIVETINSLGDVKISFKDMYESVSNVPSREIWDTFKVARTQVNALGLSATEVFGKSFDPRNVQDVSSNLHSLAIFSARAEISMNDMPKLFTNLAKTLRTAGGDVDWYNQLQKEMSTYANRDATSQTLLGKALGVYGISLDEIKTKLENTGVVTKDFFSSANLSPENLRGLNVDLKNLAIFSARTGIPLMAMNKMFTNFNDILITGGGKIDWYNQLQREMTLYTTKSASTQALMDKAMNSYGMVFDEVKAKLIDAGVVTKDFFSAKTMTPENLKLVNADLQTLYNLSEQTGIPIERMSKLFTDFETTLASGGGKINWVSKLMQESANFADKDATQQFYLKKALDSLGIGLTDVSSKLTSAKIPFEQVFTEKTLNPQMLETVSMNLDKLAMFSEQTGIPMEKMSMIFSNLPALLRSNTESLSFYDQLLKENATYATRSAESQTLLSQAMDGAGIAYTNASNKLRELGVSQEEAFGKGKLNVDRFDVVTEKLQSIDNFCVKSGISLKEFGVLFPDVGKEIGKTSGQFDMFNSMVKRGAEFYNMNSEEMSIFTKVLESQNIPVGQFIAGAINMETRLKQNAIALREFRGQQGPMGMALNKLAQDMFWVGLGTMFLYISLQGIIQRGKQVRQSILSIVQAEASLQDQQESLKETIEEYGAGSKEVIKANRDIKIQQMQLKNQMENLNGAIQQQNMTWMMFFLSLTSQAIGTGGRFASSMELVNTTMAQNAILLATVDKEKITSIIANMVEAKTMDIKTASYIKNALGLKVLIPGEKALGGASFFAGLGSAFHKLWLDRERFAVIALYGAVTMGATLLASFAIEMLMTAYQTAQMTKELDDMNKELGLMDDQLTTHSVVPSLAKMNDEMGIAVDLTSNANKEMKNMVAYSELISGATGIGGKPLIDTSGRTTNNIHINIKVDGANSSSEIATMVRNELVKGLGRSGMV